jgi:hypothetical protein
MAQWCYDPAASTLAGRIQLRLPYPQANWREEQRWNAFLLKAMHHVLAAERVFSRPAEEWGSAENEFYRQMIRELGSQQ